jgi:hypothetical protein
MIERPCLAFEAAMISIPRELNEESRGSRCVDRVGSDGPIPRLISDATGFVEEAATIEDVLQEDKDSSFVT